MGGFLVFIVIVVVGSIVFAVVGATATVKQQNKQRGEILKSPKFKVLTDYIFKDGYRPSRIVVTKASEIFYGPVDGKFLQVPGELIPPMDQTGRHALGGALETEFAYSYHLCNSGLKSGFGASPADTGVEYIDYHADFILISSGGNGGSW